MLPTGHFSLPSVSSDPCQSVNNKWHEWGKRVGADKRRAGSSGNSEYCTV